MSLSSPDNLKTKLKNPREDSNMQPPLNCTMFVVLEFSTYIYIYNVK